MGKDFHVRQPGGFDLKINNRVYFQYSAKLKVPHRNQTLIKHESAALREQHRLCRLQGSAAAEPECGIAIRIVQSVKQQSQPEAEEERPYVIYVTIDCRCHGEDVEK